MKKIKKTVKGPHVVTKDFNATDFFSSNKWKIAIPIIIVLAISATAVMYYANFSRQEAEASFLLYEAENIGDLEEIIGDFSNTKSCPIAIFKLAKKLFEEKKYNRAKDTYGKFVNSYSDHKLVPTAYLGLAYCYEEEKEAIKAIEIFNKIIDKYSNSVWAVEAEAAIARNKDKEST